MARVYSSERSCLILQSSTQHSVAIRLKRHLTSKASPPGTAGPPGTGRLPGKRRSAEAAGGPAGATDTADPSLLRLTVVQFAAGVMAEHLVQGRAVGQRRLELIRGAGGADVPQVHERDPVAVDVGLVHVVRGHQ